MEHSASPDVLYEISGFCVGVLVGMTGNLDLRFTLKSGHRSARRQCPFCANSGHQFDLDGEDSRTLYGAQNVKRPGRGRAPLTMSALCQKQTSGNDGLLRFSSRFFDQCCHLGCVREKDRVAARKFNDLRLRPLRHESLEVRIDHSVLHGNYCVARLLFPSRNCGLRLQCIT